MVSVAFRRESDEEHKEPRFELPIPPGPNLVTARGLRLIEEMVATLEAEASADEEKKRDLRYWRKRLATAQLAPRPTGDEVAFGTRVRLDVNGAERVIDIVGDDEAEPAAGRIAFSAPLPRALMGTEEGERVQFGAKTIEVVAIEVA